MSKIVSLILMVLVIFVCLMAWLALGTGTGFTEKTKSFIILENKTDKESVLAVLEKNTILSNNITFSILSTQLGIWKRVKPGKYEIRKGQSIWSIIRILKNTRLAEINLVINKVRTKEDLAKLISKSLKPDSSNILQFLSNNDSLKKFGVDTNTLFTLIIPNSYSFYWNTTLSNVFAKLAESKTAFWQKNNRLTKASDIHLTPEQVYILASIVEEETNDEGDKLKIASVYLNRLNIAMPLQACPTIKYAMKNFSLPRIYEKYLFNPSPYNTYRRKGLPPGPICTPSPKTIDIVLNAPKTDFLYFVAKSDFSGYHHFSSTFAEHSQFAKEYQKALDIYLEKKQNEQTH